MAAVRAVGAANAWPASGITVTPFGPFTSFDAATAFASLSTAVSYSAVMNSTAVDGGI